MRENEGGRGTAGRGIYPRPSIKKLSHFTNLHNHAIIYGVMKLKQLPKRMKIGWRTFDIQIIPRDTFDDKEYLGRADIEKCQIYIANDLTEKQALNTLLHEIMHVIFYKSGLVDAYKDEGICEALSESITEILIDNNLL